MIAYLAVFFIVHYLYLLIKYILMKQKIKELQEFNITYYKGVKDENCNLYS